MYDSNGAYIEVADDLYGLYQFDNIYYIKYYCKKALFAIEKMYEDININNISEAAFYYHVYIDMLCDAVGLINDRFIEKKHCSDELKESIKINRKNYSFSEEKYKLLSDKDFRNFIEHINERSNKLIKNRKYYGTFNFVHSKMGKETIANILDDKKKQNNVLNLIDKTYRIVYVEKNTNKIETKEISIDELKKELISIYKISEKIWDYLTRDPLSI